VWYDPGDITTLFKGVTNLTPVTAPGDAVSVMFDKSRGLVLGPQLVNNGTFAGGTTGWENITATLSVVDGEGVVTAASGFGYVRQVITTVVGKTYQVTCSARVGTTNKVTFSLGGVAAETTSSTTTALFCLFTATGTSANLWLQANNAGTFFIDNISVKELPGNHATQSITASQPIYGIVPAGGRRNVYTFTEDFSNAVWQKNGSPTLTNQGGGVWRLQAAAGSWNMFQALPASGTHTVSIEVKSNGAGLDGFALMLEGSNLSANKTATGDWVRHSLSGTNAGSGSAGIVRNSSLAAVDILIRFPQLEINATATPYQRVTTTYDVTEAGVASLGYLFFDGGGDFMSTGTITPGTDKAQIFAGVRKISDGATRMIVELGNTSTGFFALYQFSSGTGYSTVSAGSILVGADTSNSFAAPNTAVLAVLSDISGDSLSIRANGTQWGPVTSNQGTGNYGNHPIYIGARGGTTIPFLGHIHSLIVRFGPNLTDARISATESWVASKTAGAPSL
jgi:hypothetical protein